MRYVLIVGACILAWFPVDDAFHGHPKVRKAGLEAVGLWTLAGSYCIAYLTDGFVPEWFVKDQPRGPVLAQRLVDARLWHIGENDGEQGFWFHQWKESCSKAVVEGFRERNRERQARWRESHRDSTGRYVTNAVTNAVSNGERNAAQTKPNQTKPLSTTSGYVRGGTNVSNANTTPPPPCPQHGENFTHDNPCRHCQRRREHHEQQTLTRRRERNAAIRDCMLCDNNGAIGLDDGSTVRCQHNAHWLAEMNA